MYSFIKEIDLGKFAYSLLTLAASFYAALEAPKNILDNTTLVTVLVTVFSVTAGVLIAIFSIVSTLIHSKSWKFLENNRAGLMSDLSVFKLLFISYFLSLGFLVAYLIAKPCSTPDLLDAIRTVCVWLSTFAFMQSLALPSKISAMYIKHYDATIDREKQKSETSS